MYSDNKMVLQLISLLKQFGIRKIVVSPGSRHFAFVHSLEADGYFQLYSVVDERSAAFFALGLIQQTGEIVAVTCSSGTACMNYGSAIVEAFYQRLPLLVLSSDRLPKFLNQMEDQMYDQLDTFTHCTKYQGQLPEVKDSTDMWHCNRILNEAFIELTHHGRGPVHVNIPFLSHHTDKFQTEVLPQARKITLSTAETKSADWKRYADKLKGKQIMIIWGQSVSNTKQLDEGVTSFVENFDAVILTDKLSNCHHSRSILNTTVVLSCLRPEERINLQPDIVITLGGNYIFNGEIKCYLENGKAEHWQVGLEDKVCDPFKNLREIFEMSEEYFFTSITENADFTNEGEYFVAWKNISNLPALPTPDYNELYVIGKLLNNLPQECDLQLANSCTIRMAHFFPIHPSIRVNCNRGVNGIDGSMSTAIGFSAENAKPTFYITGDLSFFYDMNSLWIRHRSNKLRIMLINNGGGAVMYAPLNADLRKTLPPHIGAGHHTSAKGWVESLGFKYMAATNKEEADMAIAELLNTEDNQPMLIEIFTTINTDVDSIKKYYASVNRKTFVEKLASKVKQKAKNLLKK